MDKAPFRTAPLLLALACGSPRAEPPAAPPPAAEPVKPAPATPPPRAADTREAPAVTYLANEGVLLSAGGESVLVDGLHRPYEPEYAVLDADERRAVEQAAGEFAGVRLVLVSHVHRDHFDAEAVRSHLEHNPQARLISSPQVVDAVLAGGDAALRTRTEALPWRPGVRHRRRVGGLAVEFLGMSHGSGRHRDIQNFGHIVELGGRRLLHVGDAELDEAAFAALDLPAGRLDAAILPYWYFLSAGDLDAVRRLVGAARYYAVHIPPDAPDALAALARHAPAVVPLTTRLAPAPFE